MKQMFEKTTVLTEKQFNILKLEILKLSFMKYIVEPTMLIAKVRH